MLDHTVKCNDIKGSTADRAIWLLLMWAFYMSKLATKFAVNILFSEKSFNGLCRDFINRLCYVKGRVCINVSYVYCYA